jgi:hypothetical protein
MHAWEEIECASELITNHPLGTAMRSGLGNLPGITWWRCRRCGSIKWCGISEVQMPSEARFGHLSRCEEIQMARAIG